MLPTYRTNVKYCFKLWHFCRGENSNSMSLVSRGIGYACSNINKNYKQEFFSKNNNYLT